MYFVQGVLAALCVAVVTSQALPTPQKYVLYDPLIIRVLQPDATRIVVLDLSETPVIFGFLQ